ncbi:tryptophan dimethylallyltransferase family protein [Micromonospora sp. NPDC050200]|uniref:tryptophan dimethylallyltransferase family protein n=1 Tax=Micromonospora sp. NPDC050200 TaxID=3155664 RepID=UPI0033FB1671
MTGPSIFDHLSGQLARLCEIADIDPGAPLGLLGDLLGPTGSRPLSEPPLWPSNVADDHTPVEFSIACNVDEPPTLRILGEALGSPPDLATNRSAAYRFLNKHAHRFGLSMSRLALVQDLFDTVHPQGVFTLWHSLVFRRGRQPEFKVYFNPELAGVGRAPDLVEEALRRLGVGRAYQTMVDHAVRPGELGRRDRLTFFALDLHDGPHSRVKLYVTHHDAEVQDVVRAAGAVDGVDVADIAEFCAVAGGGREHFDGLPLVGSYTFTNGADEPVGYSLYVPIRGYVSDDEEAHDRVSALLARYGFDGGELDRAIKAVTRRPLCDGVGLIAHVSLRLGPPRPGVTVYLSAEAYRVDPPRPPQVSADGRLAEGPADRAVAEHV